MKYLILDTADALALDRAFQSLAKPPTQDVETTRHLGHVEHPDRDEQAMKLPEGVTLYVQPEADISEFTSLVSEWLDDSAAQEAEALLEENRGSHISVLTMLQESTDIAAALGGQVVERSELEADGWFPEPDLV